MPLNVFYFRREDGAKLAATTDCETLEELRGVHKGEKGDFVQEVLRFESFDGLVADALGLLAKVGMDFRAELDEILGSVALSARELPDK